jgi:hypothetical protein
MWLPTPTPATILCTQPTKQKDGTPIGVLERNVEKIVSLRDNTVYNKTEFFNDQIDFMGFLVKYGNTDFAQYTSAPHVVSNYQDNGIFYSDAKTAHLKQTLHTPGATIRVKSNKVYRDAKYFASVYFHEGHPQEEKVVTFTIPEWLEVEILERNFEGFQITKTNTKFNIDASNEDAEEESSDEEKPKKKPVKKPKDTNKYITYTIKDLKAGEEEDLFPGPSRNIPHLIVLCKKYDKVKAKKEADLKAKEEAKEAAKNNKGKKDQLKRNPLPMTNRKRIKLNRQITSPKQSW